MHDWHDAHVHEVQAFDDLGRGRLVQNFNYILLTGCNGLCGENNVKDDDDNEGDRREAAASRFPHLARLSVLRVSKRENTWLPGKQIDRSHYFLECS